MKSESSQQKYLNLFIIPILGIALALYYQVIEFDFLLNFDDDLLIMNSPELRSVSWENIKHVFTSFKEGLYHPITSLAWMLQIDYFGLDSHAFHHTSLVFHLLNTLLVFIFGKLLSKRIDVGLIAALLFAIQPMHAVNIGWVSAQKDLFVIFFFLLSLITYVLYLSKKRLPYYGLCFLFALLAMLSKASAIVIPLILILIDWLHSEGEWKKRIVSKVPFFILAFFFGVANYMAQAEYGYIRELGEDIGIVDRISFVFYAAYYYLQKFLIPLDLAPKNLYPESGSTLPILFYLSFLFISAIGYLAYRLRRKELWLVFGILFYLIAIAPTLKLIPTGNDIVSNRYAYMAYIGLYIALAYYIVQLKTISRILVLCAISLFWIRESYVYVDTYKDSHSVWTAVIDAHEDRKWGLAMAYNERGQIAFKEGKYKLAQGDINKALAIDPNLSRALMNRANLYDRAGKLEEALKDLNRVIELEPNNIDAIKIRSTVYGKMNRIEESLRDLEKALELDSENPELYNNLGIIYSMQAENEKAIQSFKKAVELAPFYLQAHMNLGKLYLDLGKLDQALRQLAIVYDKDPNLYYNAYLLGKTYLLMQEKEKSEQILRKFAVEEKQASQIANSLFRDSLFETSIQYYTIALGAKDIRSKTLYQRAQSYKALNRPQEALDDLLALIEVVPNPQFFFEIAMLYKELENIEECCTFLKEAEKREHPEAPSLIKKYCLNS